MQGKRRQRQERSPAATAQRSARSSVTKGSAVSRSGRAADAVRIIGGRWKRTPLPVADALGLRPTPDRVRETLFNWIAHRFPDLDERSGLDLFAGTGALGFELASRGARSVVLIEADRAAAALLQRTRDKLQAEAVEILCADALGAVTRLAERSFDIIFVDPPFDSALLAPALQAAARAVTPDGVIYAEAPRSLGVNELAAAGLAVVRAARAGRVHFHLLQRASP